MIEWAAYLAAGILAGIVAGLFGVGGGLIIVPILFSVFSWQGVSADFSLHMAVGTSLMTICFTSLSSAYAHHRSDHVNWELVKQLVIPLLIGGFIGALIATDLNLVQLKLFFACFVLLAAIRIWLPIYPSKLFNFKQLPVITSYGGLTGIISAIVGIGGCTLIVPYLLFAGESMKRAVGTSAACGFPIAVSGALGFMLFGQHHLRDTSSWQTGFIHWPAFIGIISASLVCARLGAKLAKYLPATSLKKLFSLLLFIIAMSFFLR